MWNLKKILMNLFTKQKQSYRYRKQTYSYQRGKMGVGRDKLGILDLYIHTPGMLQFMGWQRVGHD